MGRAKSRGYDVSSTAGACVVTSPTGYKFHLVDKMPTNKDPVVSVSLASSNLKKTIDYWSNVANMKVYQQSDTTVTLGYDDSQASLIFTHIGTPVDHGNTNGRVAFSCPVSELESIEASARASGNTVLTPLVSLDTPGKATVSVVILADPDGHEICFVGDEAFRELSQVDPTADALINTAIQEDKSDEWFSSEGGKPAAQ